MTTTNDYTKLKKFSDLYDCAREAYGETMERLERNLEQYRGSMEIDGGMENASMVRNITYELIESEISPDIPCAKVEAAGYTERSEDLAFAAERLLYMARERLPLEEVNDADERSTYIFGGSILFLEWQKDERGEGEIGIRQLSPLDFVPEPGIGRIEDMSYCFLKFTTNKGELIAKYGVAEEDLSRAECGYRFGGSISLDDTVNLIIAFYKSEDGTVGRFIFSGELVLADEEDYYGSFSDEGDEFLTTCSNFENNNLQKDGILSNSARVKK